MKNAKWWLGLMVAGGLWSASAWGVGAPKAVDTVVGGVTWSYSIGEDGIIVTGADPAKGRLAVPATFGEQAVVEIGYRAFASCEELTAVEIPVGTTRIAERAFQYCSMLQEVSIPAGVTNIGAMAFQYCESLATLALPQNLEDIGADAFYHCGGLATLYVPSAWWGTAKTEAAGVGSGCRTIYGEPGRETLFFNANGGTCGTVFRSYATGQPYGWLPDAERANHTFDGWFPSTYGGTRISGTNAASDADGSREVYAHWTPLVQTVTFDGNGGTSATQTYPCGELYAPLPKSTRPNYAFAGWWTLRYGGERITEASLVTQDRTRTLYAHWTLTEQTVLFDAQGGTCDTTNRNYAVGGTYSSLPKPTLEGYDFDGWFTESSGGDRVSAASAVTETDWRTLYAHWSLVEQVVAFDANGGACDTESRVYAVGETYTWLPEAERARYVFAGWWSERYGGKEVEVTDPVTATRYRTLYAHWTPTVQTVTFDATEGWCDTSSGLYTVGQPYAQFPEPVREHYAFAGWWSEWYGGNEVTAADTVPAWETRTLYAHWTLAEQVVTFEANDGSWSTTNKIYAVGGTYAPLPAATREHYAFAGWWTSSDGGDEVTATNAVTAWETRTLYAHWTLVEQVVAFEANGGSCETGSKMYILGETYAPLPAATWEHYDFAGWFTEAFGGEQVSETTLVTTAERRTLYAHWTLAEQEVSFNANGGSCNTGSRTYAVGGMYGDLPMATREHYAFAGWWTDASGGDLVDEMSAVTASEARTLHAHWTLTEQVVIFWDDDNSGIVESHVYPIGKHYDVLPELTREHYGFEGWWTAKDGGERVGPDSVVTPVVARNLYTRWSLLEQVVTFNASGGSCDTTDYTYVAHQPYAFLPSAKNEPDWFNGWWTVDGRQVSETDIVLGSSELTLYARWITSADVECCIENGAAIVTNIVKNGRGNGSSCYLPSIWYGYPVTGVGENIKWDYDEGLDGTPGLHYWIDSTNSPMFYPGVHQELKSLHIPGSVTNIGWCAFWKCRELQMVSLEEGLECIEAWAFQECSALKSVMLPDSLTSLHPGAFSGCSSLQVVSLGKGLTNLSIGVSGIGYNPEQCNDGYGAAGFCADSFFGGCYSLTEIRVAEDNPAYASDGGVLFSKNKEVLLWMPRGRSGVYTVPDSVTSIGEYAFYDCRDLTRVTIPDGMTSIGGEAFAHCSGLTSVAIPDSVTSLGASAFSGCDGLQTLHVPAAWEGTSILSSAGVPSGCKVYYGPFIWQTATFDANGGQCRTVSRLYFEGERYGELPEATREKYAFAGWWTEKTGGVQVTADSVVDGNETRTLYAHWQLADDGYAAWLAERGEAESALPVEGDADGDGMTNWEEYVAGTNPRDGEERLEARIRWVDGKPDVETSVAVPKGRTVRVEGKKSLVGEEGWTDVTGKEASWAKEGWRFFRVGVELP